VPALPAGVTYIDVAAGDYNTLARRSDGSAVAWGLHEMGQTVFPAPPPGCSYVELTAGWSHTVGRYELTTPEPEIYCTAKPNSIGCIPQIESSGIPSAGAGCCFTVGATQILRNKLGTFFYGTNGTASIPFQGGFLCVQGAVKRTPVQNSGGGTPCGGTFALDFNAWIASGADPALSAGSHVYGQYWSRDPTDAFGTSLTDAIQFAIGP
jgi:hypothetical protein